MPPQMGGAPQMTAEAAVAAANFAAGADRRADGSAGSSTPSARAAAAPADQLPWEGLDDKRRSPAHQMRMTEKELATLNWLVLNKPGTKSRHLYMLELIQKGMAADVKLLTGEDVVFTGRD
ncbi:hypothetical protein CSC66_09315 [Pseudoxanthomonas kaohsiungensis]|nr:hypothetical protein CSC66_09315 [Pseudoxanthomonas kaohsiungensis]